MSRRQLKPEDINEVFIAGSFGNHVDPLNAKILGMIPDIPTDRIKFVGNTAIMGADLTLLSVDIRREFDEIIRKVKYIELTVDPLFPKEFRDALFIPHRDPNRFPSIMKFM